MGKSRELVTAPELVGPAVSTSMVGVAMQTAQPVPGSPRMVSAALKRRPDLKDAQSLLQEIWAGERK